MKCWIRSIPVFLAVFALAPRAAEACSVCFGDPSSDMVKGAKAGVLVLAVIVYAVVTSMVGVAGFWALKARRLAAAEDESRLSDELS